MATITPIATGIPGGVMVQWNTVTSGDTCTPWPIPGSADVYLNPPDHQALTDRCAQAFGGTVGTVHMEGSNIGPTVNTSAFATLHLVDGTTAASLTTSQLWVQILEPSYYVRPAPTGGAAATSVTCKFVTGARYL